MIDPTRGRRIRVAPPAWDSRSALTILPPAYWLEVVVPEFVPVYPRAAIWF